MKVWRGDPLTWGPAPPSGSAVTIGVFDGVHRGHQAVLFGVAARAAELGGLEQVVLTFDRHPRSVVDPASAPALLTSLDQRIELLEDLEIDVVGVLPFEQIRDSSPDDFVSKILVGAFGARLVAVGADFRFGRGRSGDVESLRQAGTEYGFEVDAIDLSSASGVPISSTTIRSRVRQGDVEAAADLLGRNFAIVGTVVMGDQRGRTIGFPTANVIPDPRFVVPKRGVYAAWVWIDDRHSPRHPAVVNVGIRPTFGGDTEVVEAHLLDFEGDLYGQRIGIEMVSRLRDERVFDGVESLVAQIRVDADTARSLLS